MVILSEPFERVAFDLAGPFPKAKYGYCFLLTSICLATRWPDALPLKDVRAKTVVAWGMFNTFARTEFPLELLTGQEKNSS